jgi:hypothetical protein
MNLPNIVERKKIKAPTVTPQALLWDGKQFWLSSRDLGTLYKIDISSWKIVDEVDPPGIAWAGVSLGDGEMRLTLGKGLNDDRYIYRYSADQGWSKMFACPDFTGSYLGFDGKHLHMSQWYEKHILVFDEKGNVLRKIDIGEEICGFTFVDGTIYVIRGIENKNVPNKSEEWKLARVNGNKVEDIARIPFAARSLAFDGENFWSNHRAANETVSFSLPHGA